VDTPLSAFFNHHISELVLKLLNREWKIRPNASEVLLLLSSHIQLLNYPIAQTLAIDVQSYPSYIEWKELIGGSGDFLHRLLCIYRGKGEKNVALVIGQLIRESTQQTPERDKLSLWECLAEMYLEKGDYDAAEKAFQDAIAEQPTNYWLWSRFCEAYVARGDVDGAISCCKQGISKSPNWSPVMVLNNLCAAKGDYGTAIQTYMKLVIEGWDGSLWENLLSKSTIILPDRNTATMQFLKQYKDTSTQLIVGSCDTPWHRTRTRTP
jgi:tetratricopeptide (TPR) repeat protein